MELENLMGRTIEFIEGRWHEKTPFYETNPQIRGLPQLRQRDMEAIFPPIKHGVDFEELINGAEELSQVEVFRRINQNIPDSEQVQVIDFCSYTGIRFSHGFAKRHPKTDVLLVDRIDDPGPGLFPRIFEIRLREMGNSEERIKKILSNESIERYEVEVEFTENMQESMQRLFESNNVTNMRYLHALLDPSLVHILQGAISPNKRTYCTGFNCPDEAGILSIRQAIQNNATAMVITISGLEYLGLRRISERSAFVKDKWDLLEQGQAREIHDRKNQVFDYRKPEEKKLGFALKQVKVLDIMMYLEERGYKTRPIIIPKSEKRSYNIAEHYICAFKDHDILAA